MNRINALGISYALVFLSASCSSSLSVAATVDINIYQLSQLCIGMTQAEVLHIMNQPYDVQRFQEDESHYEVWFYVTGNLTLGQTRMMSINLTPLTFLNGTLIGTGWHHYNRLLEKQKEACRAKKAKPPVKQTEPVEDKKLEESIQKAAKS